MGTLLALMLSSCNFSWQQDGSGSREYKTLTVTTGERTLFREYAAAVQGRQSVEIRPQVSGTITEVCIDEGAKVRKGQTLFVIDQVPYRAALETAEANVRSAGASVATARLTAGSKRGVAPGTDCVGFRPTNGGKFAGAGRSCIGSSRSAADERPQRPLLYDRKEPRGRCGRHVALPRRGIGRLLY